MKYKIFKLLPQDPHFWYSIDANFDNQFTISDVWIIIKKIILFPGDFFIMWKSIWAYTTTIGKFLEFSNQPHYGGLESVIYSIIIWFLLGVITNAFNSG
ncbi:hypothetical protein OAJ30_00025 [Alphaproteobacteria bacterium]|nr:hypothetical protein [Alphaproteobacteria bacterium]